MSLKINVCKNCGKLPELGYDESNYDFKLYCDCQFPKYNEGIGGSLQSVAEDWNELNPQ